MEPSSKAKQPHLIDARALLKGIIAANIKTSQERPFTYEVSPSFMTSTKSDLAAARILGNSVSTTTHHFRAAGGDVECAEKVATSNQTISAGNSEEGVFSRTESSSDRDHDETSISPATGEVTSSDQPSTSLSTSKLVIMELSEPANQVVLSEDDLAAMPVKDLNSLLRGLPDSEVFKLKHRRRTIKNRSYAQTSRTKRSSQKQVLEEEKTTLEVELHKLAQECDSLRQERDEARMKLEAFEEFARMSGINFIMTTDSSDLSIFGNLSSSMSNMLDAFKRSGTSQTAETTIKKLGLPP